MFFSWLGITFITYFFLKNFPEKCLHKGLKICPNGLACCCQYKTKLFSALKKNFRDVFWEKVNTNCDDQPTKEHFIFSKD